MKPEKDFAGHQNRMGFMCLDVNRDLILQGMQPASYDVIFAAGALRGTNDINALLQNLRRVLTPGGQLVLQELTVPNRFEIGFGLGVTPDWWYGQQDDDYRDRTMNTSQWDAVLRNSGFSGTDLVIRDSLNSAAHCSSVMVSREAAARLGLPNTATRILVVIDNHDDFQSSLAESVSQNRAWNLRVLTLNEMVDEKLASNDYVICLADGLPGVPPPNETTDAKYYQKLGASV